MIGDTFRLQREPGFQAVTIGKNSPTDTQVFHPTDTVWLSMTT